MHDRWPPEPPPRFEPPPSTRRGRALVLTALACVAVAVLLAALYWAMLVVGAFRDVPG